MPFLFTVWVRESMLEGVKSKSDHPLGAEPKIKAQQMALELINIINEYPRCAMFL